ncbi:MAG TPA: N-acetylmuramoyl-L-alanine amidase [Candidatus Limnocylindria bacterium]|nr:N-acetylmuramoyl-L-alanine amidase [Candidatus Limnocylindria bacterium]
MTAPRSIRPARRALDRVLRSGLALLLLAGCGATPWASESVRPSTAPSVSVAASPSETAAEPTVVPAPGLDSAIYPPNPGAIVVALDPGHGGCLDWGVPDPSERGTQLAEKTLTLAIAEELRDRLEADGIGVVMLREGDEALAGDFDPRFDCDGPPWRDVDGDGEAGFEETGRVRTRDELQARIDRANLAGADAFVSIHINSLTQDGVVFELAATQTFYDDETPWGADRSAALADGIQAGVVDAIDPLATEYERQDRGTEAVAYYVISRTWADGDRCEAADDTWCKPHRGLQMPGVLSEVGSITLRAEHDMLASAEGQAAIADGLFDGLAGWFSERELAARVALADALVGAAPQPVEGDGPPFWAPVAPDGPIRLRVTNTGTEPIPAGAELVAGWEESDLPYLAAEPGDLAVIGDPLPALEPGEAIDVTVELPPAPGSARGLAWISLSVGSRTLAEVGSAALQLANRDPEP